MKSIQTNIAAELSIHSHQVNAVLTLLSEGATIPFIARYRKEKTGGLDEVQIATIQDRLEAHEKLEARRKTVLASLMDQAITDRELIKAVEKAASLASLEDLYLPYRPKRRTRAIMARERGLEPLAEHLWAQTSSMNPLYEAAAFVNKDVPDAQAALDGARDILAEKISEDAVIRSSLRDLFFKKAMIASQVIKGKETEGTTFRDYFAHEEPISRAGGHRILAMFRGEREGFLRISIRPEQNEALNRLLGRVIYRKNKASEEVEKAAQDAWKRLIAPALETELRQHLKEKADQEAIQVFATNLHALLMAPPMGAKPVIAVDPGFRSGCKVVVLDSSGSLQADTLIFPMDKKNEAEQRIKDLLHRFGAAAIAIGNGTAGRETETFFRTMDLSIPVIMVNEAGASVYSASSIAREELPDQDVTVRGAVSIGRRLMDPLSELVKIDPKAIGVGQYQHDVDQKLLRQRLDMVVSYCVNRVGVNLNTASASLLSHVSGLGPGLARAVVQYRAENGPFRDRKSLMKVPRLGARTFEQAAGFLRVPESANPLDGSSVHPERYALVTRMANDLGTDVAMLMKSSGMRAGIRPENYVDGDVGLPTLKDILAELDKPGRDPREGFSIFSFADVHTPSDLKPGMKLPGIVTNVTNFGCFVDVGVHQDGLVHISQMADRYVKNPHEVVIPGQTVNVWVLNVDIARKRISLSMKERHDNSTDC
ncbi:RNA-binding transcriptional accessory protein [Desulfobotulus sp. H1]|uniref:RNA-binding transcriptional accessory protein n=1 Tax=Desulfobotulus pelophilus TaxID=2823377 RepID=A0ABT3NA67_9BACT|nr:Tex family protein [Desulfobotulus pelophilus]MCW7754359.1 RNA-binding transcriptional accessory protein [Desulfobotulus pelophilus]